VTNLGHLAGDNTPVFEDSDRPIRFDGLIGDAIMRNTPQDLQAFRALTIQGSDFATQGSPILFATGSQLPLNGFGYKEVTARVSVEQLARGVPSGRGQRM
jgi:hypothetical protein